MPNVQNMTPVLLRLALVQLLLGGVVVVAPCSAQESLAPDSEVASVNPLFTLGLTLEPPLRPGDLFDEAIRATMTKQARGGYHFHKVPSWLSGTWRLSEDGHFVLAPEKTSGSKRSAIDASAYVGFECGIIADSTGQVWTRDTTGSWSESADRQNYGCFLRYSETMPNADELRSRGETVAIAVDGESKISSCLRGTTEQSNRSLGEDQIEVIKTSRSFDWQGKPKTSSRWKATYKRVASFNCAQKIDKYSDLSRAFVQFLGDRGMADRVPDDLVIHADAGVPEAK